MAIRPLVIAPDERLNVPSTKVAVVDDTIRLLLDDMLETMYANDGIGLAAVQIGVHRRCVVVDVAVREGRREPMKLVNPEIIAKSQDASVFTDGCLSFPDQYSDVVRPESVIAALSGRKRHGKNHRGLGHPCHLPAARVLTTSTAWCLWITSRK